MNRSRLLWAAMLTTSVAPLCEAQYLAPLAPVSAVTRAADVATAAATEHAESPLIVRPARRDTLPARRELSPVGAVLGGIGGGVVGAFVGMAAGAGAAEGCQGEDCGLLSAVLGLAIGESLGLAVGAHLGSRSTEHGNIVLTTLTSTAILVSGTFLGAAMGQPGVAMIPLTPAMQLAATWAIESAGR